MNTKFAKKTPPPEAQSEGRPERTGSLLRDLALIGAATGALGGPAIFVSHPAAYIGLTLTLTAGVVWGFGRIDRRATG